MKVKQITQSFCKVPGFAGKGIEKLPSSAKEDQRLGTKRTVGHEDILASHRRVKAGRLKVLT